MADFDVLAEAFVRRDEGADTVNVEVSNPCYDYVPPHLVSLFVTDTGGYTPSYVYRLLAEYYSRWGGGVSSACKTATGRQGGVHAVDGCQWCGRTAELYICAPCHCVQFCMFGNVGT